jgi:hypothetical protein
MARPETIPLDVPAAVGVGKSSNVFRFRDKTVQISGPFTGSLQLEVSLDGNDYEPVGPVVTAPGLFTIPFTVEFLRVRVAVLTSGTPKAVAAGFDFRAE